MPRYTGTLGTGKTRRRPSWCNNWRPGEHLLFVELNLGKQSDGAVVGCCELLRQYPVRSVFLKLIKDGKRAVSLLTEELWVVPDQRLVQALKRLGCQVVMTHGAS